MKTDSNPDKVGTNPVNVGTNPDKVGSKLKITLDLAKPKPPDIIPFSSVPKAHLPLAELNKFRQSRDLNRKLLVDTDLNFFQWIIAKLFQIKFEGELKMWDTIKKFLVAKIVQWILKVGSGVLLTLGISNQSVEEIVAALVSLFFGIVYSLFTHKKVALTNPQEFLKFK